MRAGRWLLAMLLVPVLAACEREQRSFTTPMGNPAAPRTEPRTSANQPAERLGGAVTPPSGTGSPYDDNAFGVAQGKRLYRWYNCNGCHANGGGGMGPPLMDAEWRYGSAPDEIFRSIVQGRPNGMPSFGGHIPEDQVWQIVAYVRSMSGQLRKDVAPSRSDALSSGEPENARQREKPRPEPPPPDRPTGGSRQ